MNQRDENWFSLLHPTLRYVLSSWMGWKDFRDIQVQTLEAFQTGSDLLIISPTAGGKSEAACIPILDTILKNGDIKPVCLYIAPLKALINDIADRLSFILNPLHYDLLVCHGDAPLKEIPESPVLILTTPESLMVHLYRRNFSLLSSIRYCIIDELHALADTIRGSQVLAALSRIEEENGSNIMRIGLSATIGNPNEILDWMRGSHTGVLVTGNKKQKKHVFHLHPVQKDVIPSVLLKEISGKRSLVFSGSRKDTEKLAFTLKHHIPDVYVHHSSLSSGIREKTEEKTGDGSPFSILCTNTLELGIDIGDLDLVVQIGSAKSVSSFIQRLGRTGRRGSESLMHIFSTDPEETCHILSALLNIKQGLIEPVIPPCYPYELLVREVLLTVMKKLRVSKAVFNGFLLKKPYQRIEKNRLYELLDHLISHEWLSLDGDLVIPGINLEKIRKNPGFLYSLIGDQVSDKVISSDGEDIGSIPKSVSRDSRFILGGNIWQHTGVKEGDSLVVQPSGGYALPPVWQGNSAEVSKLILSGVMSIVSGTSFPFLVSDAVKDDVKKFRDQFPPNLSNGSISIISDGNETIFYTFLGKTWNRIIGDFVGKKFRYHCIRLDPYSVTFSGPLSSSEGIRIFETISSSTWEDIAECSGISKIKKESDFDLLPFSCIREQWYVDFLKVPHFIDSVRKLEVVWN